MIKFIKNLFKKKKNITTNTGKKYSSDPTRRYWEEKVDGILHNDFTRGAGYYFLTGIINLGEDKKPILWETPTQSGKIKIFVLKDYKLFSDPDDMIKESHWSLIGYKGEKAIKDCSFEEFASIYCTAK